MCSVPKQSAPKIPEPAPTLPPLQTPTEAMKTPETAANDSKRRQAAAYGRSKTILTGSQGDTSTYTTDKKNLLGL